MTTVQQPAENLTWYTLSAEAAAEQMGVNPDQGLDAAEAGRRLAQYGPNEPPTEPPPNTRVRTRGQLSNRLIVVGSP